MKKIFALFTILAIVAGCVFAAGAQEGQKAAPAAKEMTHDELVAAAQAEGSLTVYTFTSRGSKVGEAFEAKYGIKTEVTQLSDSEMITKVTAEAKAGQGADIIFAQDSGRVLTELFDTGYVVKYTPASVAAAIPAQYADPLVYDLNIKAFIYNDETDTDITNVWQLTEPQWKGRIQYKDPQKESVGMNFFVMLTTDEWAGKLAQAYKDLYGKDLVLTTPNAGYEFIKMLLANSVLGSSDSKICEAVGAKGQAQQLYGLFTINKLRNASEKNLALSVNYNMVPFNGFMYPIYTGLTSIAAHPNAAKLFMEFAYSEEGWKPMDTLGDNNPILGSSEDSLTIADWEKTLVIEDPEYLAANRYEVEQFIVSIL
ncbi:MAG: extracellular solute-binding protein [Spirochaetales bacterium]|nr:extracellular solute-binding protein [Spirochaetales bacterium]